MKVFAFSLSTIQEIEQTKNPAELGNNTCLYGFLYILLHYSLR